VKIALLACLLALTAPSAAQDYGVINRTGRTITHLYLSPTNDNEWGDDILGKDVLANGEECGIEFDPNDEECAYDIKIIDGKEVAWTVTNVDLCKYTKVTFSVQKGKMIYTAK